MFSPGNMRAAFHSSRVGAMGLLSVQYREIRPIARDPAVSHVRLFPPQPQLPHLHDMKLYNCPISQWLP